MADYPVKDKDYDLVSTLYHSLQGLQNAKQYAKDASSDGDEEAAKYFENVQSSYQDLSDKAKTLLKKRLQ